MSKKILRWTVGDCSDIGLKILNVSIKKAKKIFEKFNFDFYVCSNSNNSKIKKICLNNNVKIIESNWNSFPLPKEIIPKNNDINSPIGIPKKRQGSFWKLCPPRLFLNSYEIICDNDLIFQKCPQEIELFLNSNKTLISEESVFHFGKYKRFISRPYNSGLYGFPPMYDFSENLIKTWNKYGKMKPLLSRDEQGIIILTLLSHDNIKIPEEKTCFVFDKGEAESAKYSQIKENGFDCHIVDNIKFKKCSNLKKNIIHFLGSNREKNHFYWNAYKNKF